MTMNQRLEKAGVKTIRTEDAVYLEYDGKRIIRPSVNNCVWTIKREFNLEI